MKSGRGRMVAMWTWCAAAVVASSSAWGHHQQTQDLLNDEAAYDFDLTPYNLELRQYVQMPAGSPNIISMTTRLGDPRLYVTTQEGRVHLINPGAGGTGTPSTWFNITTVTTLSGSSGQQGLQSVAFHPDFDKVGQPGYGKFYATLLRTTASNAGTPYLGTTPGVTVDGVLAEVTYNHGANTFGSYRELFRVKMPVNDHPIKQARFNPYSKPGDEDYGLLYMTHGDSNSQHSPGDYPQYLDNALGKMIRVNPLDPDGAGTARYSIPATNPFANYSGTTPAGHSTVLGEIFAYGFRNPHNFSFNKDDNGNVHILVGNIGRANVEEVDLAVAGGNYGWPKREGPFIEDQVPTQNPSPPNPGSAGSNYGYIEGTSPLPSNEASLTDGYGKRNTYPVSQFDHNAEYGRYSSDSSIASGFVIRNGSDPNLHNQIIFNNFPEHDSFAYHADFDEMLAAVNQLDPNDTSRDEPGELTYALPHVIHLALDHDNNSSTPAQIYDDFNAMLNFDDLIPPPSITRNDGRYGEGVFGEMYISTKQRNGVIYLVTNSVPLAGDYNKDRVVDTADYVMWRDTEGATGYHLAADGNGDAVVDGLDYTVWRSNFGKVWSGSGSGSGAAIAVPEPRALMLGCTGTFALLAARRRKCRR